MPDLLSQNLQPPKSKSMLVVVVIVFMVQLSACGNKGELYLPEKDDSAEVIQVEKTTAKESEALG